MRNNYVGSGHSIALHLGHRHTHLHLLLGTLLLLLVPSHLPILAHFLRYGLVHRFLHVLADHPGHLVALLLEFCVALLLLAGLAVSGGHVLALEDGSLCARFLAVLAPRADFLRLVAALP